MRETKYRLYSEKYGRNENVQSEYDSTFPSFQHVIDLCENHEGNNLVQFTGLKDKNGKEIYEGDIIKWNTSANGSGEDCFSEFKFINNGGAIKTSPYINGTSEVAGNIYENPELIK